MDELVAFSEGASVLNPKIQREGIVLRPLAEEYDEDVGGRLSFKVINPKFLLKYDEWKRTASSYGKSIESDESPKLARCPFLPH